MVFKQFQSDYKIVFSVESWILEVEVYGSNPKAGEDLVCLALSLI